MKVVILCDCNFMQKKYNDFLVVLEHHSRQILNFLTIKAGFIAVPNQQRFLDNQNRKSRHCRKLQNQKADLFSKSKCLQEKCLSQL